MRVIVVGAGIAGLSAAHRLAEAGAEVTVLESAPGPGGRMSTLELDTGPMERGAQFLSTGYRLIPELIDAAGLADDVTHVSGRTMVLVDGRTHTFDTGSVPSFLTGGVLRARDVLPALRGAFATRGLAARPTADLGAWLDLDMTEGRVWARKRLGAGVTTRLLDPALQGLLFYDGLSDSAALAGVMAAFSARRAQALTIRGGVGRLTAALAKGAPLRPSKGWGRLDVEYGVRVERVERVERRAEGADGPRAVVHTGQGRRGADAVILATPSRESVALLADPTPAERGVLTVPYSQTLVVGLGLAEPLDPDELDGAYGVLVGTREPSPLAGVAVYSRTGAWTKGEGDVITVMFRTGAVDRLWAAEDAQVVAAAVAALAPLVPGLAGRVTDARVVRWDRALPMVPFGHAAAVARYRSQAAPGSPVLLAGDHMGFPWTDAAAFNGRWAAETIVGAAT
ncbi:protoporphyrinogen/coproporphyrinogen oxidase [Streptomyces sp. 6N223]|uniref:protoporphyrinogen/coproporphyrinogen oxidase n=1 Tax=Streptomyces sp. 6N223 TaxID=3457412 RepID=UPI003FD516BB